MRRWLCSVMMGVWCVSAPSYAAVPKVQTLNAASISGLLIEDHSVPMVTCHVRIKHAGSAYEHPDDAGLASFTAKMLMEGAGDRDATAFRAHLDRYAIAMDSFVSRDDMNISFTSLSQYQEEAWQTVAAIMTQPRFDDAEWNRLRDRQYEAFKRAETQPSSRLSQAFIKTAFEGHPYGHPINGTRSTLERITPDAMQDFLQRVLARDSMEVSCSGDVTVKQLQGFLTKSMSDVPQARTEPAALLQPIMVKNHKEPIFVQLDEPQTKILIATPSIDRHHKLFYAAYVLNHIVGGGTLSSRLGEELREKRGLTYGVYSALRALEYSPWFSVGFSTQTQRATEGYEAALAVLRDVIEKGVSEQELRAAQDYLTGSFALSLDSNSEKVAYLSLMQRHKLGTDYLEKRNDHIRSVTLQDMQEAAKLAINLQQSLIIWVGEKPYEPSTSNKKHTSTTHEPDSN
ncbi:MAG: insulinase family protein [Alphaproteobacteria bacterium]|nr:MAG: insulinase family protein [Alphaproteobacteria bacterium]TAF14487.1 MAG: insulinase family protein [Alphaproteobacteria bacterium]TAF37497.1 MAG: insulinase family protein [Alphaproteobacteria bacterium]TAF76059.1 MAG: insulinase family protein [Alphaproteobacteria bacterium]